MSPTPTLVHCDSDVEDAPTRASIKKDANKAPSASGSDAMGSAPAAPLSGEPSFATFEKDAEAGPVHYEGSGTVESPFIVKFAEGDLENPMNWKDSFKWLLVATVAFATLCVAFASSIYAGGIVPMEEYFHISTEVATLGVTLFVLGFALGPLLWAPFSELYGRRTVFVATYLPFAVFHFGCAAARNIETLLICRALAGFFGSSPLTNAGGVISDIFSASQRALGLAFFALAPFMGPAAGPIVGGFIGEYTTWRWLFWVLCIFSILMLVLGSFIPETYTPVLLRRRALKLSRESGKVYVSAYDLKIKADETLIHKLKVNCSRPFVLLFREVIVLLMAIYAAFIYGTLYLMFGAFPIVFEEQRGWKSGPGSLPFLGIALGMILGIVINTVYINPKYVRDLTKNGGALPPEARLPIMAFGGCCLPVGLFWFAWTQQPSVHFIVPCIAVIPFGMGMVTIFLSMMSYLIDSYLMFAASALAANSVLRSIFGAVFPLFTIQMFHAMGTSWALTLLGFIALLLAPIPFVFYRYGAKIRAKSAFAPGHVAPKLSKVPTRVEEDRAAEVEENDLRLAAVEEAEKVKEGHQQEVAAPKAH